MHCAERGSAPRSWKASRSATGGACSRRRGRDEHPLGTAVTVTSPVIDPSVLAGDLAELVQIPSVTGEERAALSWLARRAQELGLEAELVEHDLAALRAHPEHPGEE